MPCLEKVGLVQAHFTKYTPFYAKWTYSSLFCYLDPKSVPNLFSNMFLSFKKTSRKNICCFGLCPVLLLLRSVWYWWGFYLIFEMTAQSVNSFLSHWSSSWLLGLYHNPFGQAHLREVPSSASDKWKAQ